jgi:hypothetical protein
VASRPDGRHQSEAYAAVAKLYEGAADRYRNASRLGSSDGVEAVIKMLDYAKNSGRYKVFVDFTGDNEMPEDVEIRLKQLTGLPRLVPILPSFTGNMNRAREARILARISNSFGNVIPGDILQFVEGKPSSNDIGFEVGYVIQASGAMYYPGKQEQFPQAARDWYTGVNFTWAFVVDVPDTKSSKFQLKMKSEPAPVFQVMSSQNLGGSESLEPASVYSAMADSAFADFGSKLLAQLSLQ